MAIPCLLPLSVLELIKILESESEVVIDWFKINKWLFYTDKFQEIVLDKRKSYLTNERITVDNQQITVVLFVELFGLQLDGKPSLKQHTS